MIDHYDFGVVVVDGTEYTSDVVCHRGKVTSWRRIEGHSVAIDDLALVLQDKPAVLVIGTGAYGVMQVPGETRRYIEEQGVRLIGKHSGEAVRAFNEFEERGEDVAIAMHLTC